ncbi:MAG: hypothetical protein ACJ8AW_13285 [Rhodopila sp.]
MSFDYDLPLAFDEPHLVVDPDCSICHGTGVMREDGRLLECTCLLRQRVLHYLTPTFGVGIAWDADFQPQPYVGNDVLLSNDGNLPFQRFRQLAYGAIKSFLINTHLQYSHRTLTPYELFRALYDGHDAAGLADLIRNINILVLVLSGDDPPAKHNYQFQIPWLLRKRRENAVPTWIVLGPALDSVAFKSCYGGLCKPLATCLAEGFIKLPLRWEDKR